jgi:hypothetical protein
MGFGFNLGMIFIILPLTIILLLIWLISRKKIFGKTLLIIWGGIIGLVVLSTTLNWIFSKKELTKKDYYGEYTIDRNYFSGKQSDWQYNHYRFEITENDSIFFYVTEKENIIRTYKGTIKTTNPDNYRSDRLIIQMIQPTHHILTTNPTIYRENWDFFLVFNSPKFNNMYFRQVEWKKIE